MRLSGEKSEVVATEQGAVEPRPKLVRSLTVESRKYTSLDSCLLFRRIWVRAAVKGPFDMLMGLETLNVLGK